MRRIDDVKDKRIRNVRQVRVLDSKRIEMEFNDGKTMILVAESEEYGYNAGMYIEKEADDSETGAE